MPHVQLVNITKRFGGLVANNNVTLDVRPGEVHSILGENGAGKTTLMNILYGLYRPTSGRILLDGRPVTIDSPQDAIALGIGMVHQHFMLVPTLTVAENFAIGQAPILRRWVARDFEAKVLEAAAAIGLPIDPGALVADLSVGQQQRVEIVRALGRGARLLILDEPTAVLTPQEARELMGALRRLASQGTSIVFISHKLKEVMEISDRISVLRLGAHVRTVGVRETTERELALLMVGRQELEMVRREETSVGRPVFGVRDLRVRDERGQEAVRGLSFDVHEGEILGVAGVAGNGQTELTEALVGLRNPAAGSVTIDGRELAGLRAGRMIRAGIGHVPEDRQVWGLFPDLSVAENLIADRHAEAPFGRNGFLQQRAIQSHADQMIQDFDIRPAGRSLRVGALSGGNKQKVVVARVFARRPRVLVINQPTRGLDVGATEYIRRRILDERSRGSAILLISADLDEILALSDRVAIMYEGRFMAVLPVEQASIERVGLLMAGVAPAAAAPG